ncbi:MAG: tetratricopeptide repeat protein, partial [Chthoniobacterales bacterium]
MKWAQGQAAFLFAAAVLFSGRPTIAQTPVPIRRAQPVEQAPIPRALPVESETPAAEPTIKRAIPVPAEQSAPAPNLSPAGADALPGETTESPEQRQLIYANALFGRKLYDLAVPEYEKFLGLYPNSPDRVTALFYMGQAYRALNRTAAARTSFQNVLREFPDAELAGPASYGLAEIFFNEKDFSSALPLFHRAAAKVKSSALALSARYFEGRCLENLDRKDEARDVYQQVIAVSNPNPYRDDSRLAVGAIFLANGRKGEALKQFEALIGETSKPSLKAEATVRAGLLALDLAQSDKDKPDQAMIAKATALLQKGRTLPDAGRWSGVAAVGLLRLEYQSGQYEQAVAEFQKSKDQVPEELRAEMMLLAGNSQRQLGHAKEAQDLYRQIIQKYPASDEAKDARYQRLIGLYNANDPALKDEIDQFLKENPEGTW